MVKGLAREIIDEFWNKCMLTRIINLYCGICSACSEL